MQKYFFIQNTYSFSYRYKTINHNYTIVKDQNNLFELIFDIASLDDYLKAWEIIEEYQIDKYNLIQYTQGIISIFSKKMFF